MGCRVSVSPVSFFAVFLCVTTAAASAQDTKTHWKVKLLVSTAEQLGPSAQSSSGGNKVKLLLDSGMIHLQGKRVKTIIPAASVAAITYDTQSHRPVKSWLKGGPPLGGGKCGNCEPVSLMLAGGIYVVGAAVLAPVKTTDHFVGVAWNNPDGSLRHVLLEVGKSDREAILAALSKVTDVSWQDLADARKRLVQELEAAESSAWSLQLDRAVLLRDMRIRPGIYQALVLEREENIGQLFIFSDKSVDLKKLIASDFVEFAAEPGEPGPQFRERGMVSWLTGVRVGNRLYRLTSNDESLLAGSESNPIVAAFSTKRGATARVKYGQHDNEPAFHFPVWHYHSGFRRADVCSGTLYVTRTRIAYDAAAYLGKDRDEFNVTRQEVRTDLESIPKWIRVAGTGVAPENTLDRMSKQLKITVLNAKGKKKTYRFFVDFQPPERTQGGGVSEEANDVLKLFMRTVTDFDATEVSLTSALSSQASPAAPRP